MYRMLDFVFILATFLEIAATVFIVVKINKFEKKIKELNENLILIHGVILEVLKQIRQVVSKINKVVKIFQNRRFIITANILKYTITAVQIIILVRSIVKSGSLLKKFKSINFKVVRKLLYANAVYKLVSYILKLCANKV